MYVPHHFATDDHDALIYRLARANAAVLVTTADGAPFGSHMPIAEAYVTPAWYPSKAEHGKTVPTWNYEAVHITGQVEWFDDAERLESVVAALSGFYEQGRPQPWSINDAPRAYIDALKRGIVGVAITAERIEAKRKLSQNKSEADFNGVADGLAASESAMERDVAALMRSTRALADDPEGN